MSQSLVVTEHSIRMLAGLPVVPTEFATVQGTVLLVVGRGGAGKTTLSATVGDSEDARGSGKKQHFIDVEGNMHVIAHRSDCTFTPINTWQSFEKLVAAAVAGDFKEWCHTLHVDNIAELIDLKIREVFGEENLNIDEQVSWPQWNRVTRDVLAKIRDLKNVSRRDGINVVFTSWDAPNKKKTYYADIQANPALQEKIPGILSFIGYIDVDENSQRRKLYFGFSNKHVSKWQCTPGSAASTVPLEFDIDLMKGPHLGTIFDVLKSDRPWPFPAK